MIIAELVQSASRATQSAPNEEVLRHELENALKAACDAMGITWTLYQLDQTLLGDSVVRFADVIHGSVIIEYEPPRSFREREASAQLIHAREQVEEYVQLTANEEGRDLSDYQLVVWDGASISFGRYGSQANWDRLIPFDRNAAHLLMQRMQARSAPLVSPSVLKSYVGLDAAVGQQLVPLLFAAIVAAEERGESGRGGGKPYLLYRDGVASSAKR
jgi:hypothetical protein